jgi:hypothetical protein
VLKYSSFEDKRQQTDENGMKRVQKEKGVFLKCPADVRVIGELRFNFYSADYTRHGNGP